MTVFLIFSSLMTGMVYATPSKIIIIRHAEDPEDGPGLSTRGLERAMALAPFFQGEDYGLTKANVGAVYAAKISKKSMRSYQTCLPTARALEKEMITNYTSEDLKNIASEILNKSAYNNKIILICWKHEDIYELTKAFGVTTAPSKWPGSKYDRVYLISFEQDKVKFQNLPQRLLFKDSKK